MGIYNLTKQITLKLLSLPLLRDVISFNENIIYCYHDISLKPDWEFCESLKNFELQIENAIKHKKIIPLRKLIKGNSKKGLAITFDDGYENVYKYAYPILQKHGIVATVFIMGIGGKFQGRKLLSRSQLKELAASGWEIGYHTGDHMDLTILSKSQVEQQLEGKRDIEKQLGIKINSFAYPHGKYTEDMARKLRRAGFEFAYTIDGGRVKKGFNKSRVTTPKYVGIGMFSDQYAAASYWLKKCFRNV